MYSALISAIQLFLYLQAAPMPVDSATPEMPRACFDCHASGSYQYLNTTSGKMMNRRMCSDFYIDSARYRGSVHGSFGCTDCHSAGFEAYPHPAEAKMEEQWACIDCHGYDENFAHYHFEKIQEEFEKSVHFTHDANFTCWQCHDAHTYKPLARRDSSIGDVIEASNAMCLQCHGNVQHMGFAPEAVFKHILPDHEWLPNAPLHFKKVRCIECHTQTNDTLLVAHNIVPGNQAVRNCVECHSRDSKLMYSLYRYQVPAERNKFGFLNAKLVKDYFVIGANRNYYLNIASLVIFGLILGGIAVHIVLRIISKR